MAKIGFYQLRTSPLEQALLKLLEKALDAGHRIRVVGASDARMESLSAALWTCNSASFLPHGVARDGNAEHQPIYLTAESTDSVANENLADLVVTLDNVEPVLLAGVVRYLDVFDGNDETALKAARQRWKRWKAEDHSVSYWQQGEGGGWEKLG